MSISSKTSIERQYISIIINLFITHLVLKVFHFVKLSYEDIVRKIHLKQETKMRQREKCDMKPQVNLIYKMVTMKA